MHPWEHSHSLHERLVCEFTSSIKFELFFRNIFSWVLIHLDSAQPRGCLHPSIVEKVSHLVVTELLWTALSDRPDVALGQSSPEIGLEQFHWRKVGLWPQSWPGSNPAEFQSHPRNTCTLVGSPSSWELSCWKCKVSERMDGFLLRFPLLSLRASLFDRREAQSLFCKP